MKKVIAFMIVGFFIFSGLNVFANADVDTITNTKTSHIDVSEPHIATKDKYCSVTFPEQTAFLLEEGKPLLPFISQTFSFPFGTIINDVRVVSETQSYTLSAMIEPAPNPAILSIDFMDTYQEVTPDESVYQSDEFYPDASYAIQKGVGLSHNEHAVIVTVKSFCQYAPAMNMIEIPVSIDISIDYDLPSEPMMTESAYKLLIITDETFADALQPLVDHKNNMGIPTKLETVQQIYPNYKGVADWEDVKLRIADAVQQLGVEFVLLAGGHKGQTDEWWVPDFRSKNYDDNGIGDMDRTYSSDLYYADLFRYDNMGAPFFEDWDTNNDGIYAEGPYYLFGGYDNPDYYPDVAVGRIPIRYSWEVPIVVDKIITYETTAYGQSWSNLAILCGGDTSPEERYPDQGIIRGIYEGELACDDVAGYLEQKGYEIKKLYTSTGVTGVDQVAAEISKGCGWVTMEMHSNAATGGSHVTDLLQFARFYSILHMDLFKNDNQYPFMVNDGCHNAQFDVTMQKILIHDGFSEDFPFSWYEWIPSDASSWFLLKEGGGAIGVIGNTALGYGYQNAYYNMGLGGWIQPRFAHAYAVQGKEYAGTIWAQGVTDYIDNFPIYTDMVDRKTIEERVLLGDPSLKIGGYPVGPQEEDMDEPADPVQNTLGTVDTPEWTKGMSWTYRIDNIEFDFSEVPSRSVYLTLTTGDIIFTVDDVSSSTYTATVKTTDLEVFADLSLDMQKENVSNIVGTGKLVNASLEGVIHFDKTTLGFQDIHLVFNGSIVTESLLPNFNFSIPAIILKLVPEIPFSVNLDVTFDEPYQLFNYPLELNKGWGLPAGTITLDGTITSRYFRILLLLDRIAGLFGQDILPQYLAELLPVIDISDLLSTFGMSNVIEFAGLDNMFDENALKCRTEEEVTVDAGTFTTYDIWFMVGAGELFYAPDIDNIVKIDANIDRFIPIMDTISLDLIEYSVP